MRIAYILFDGITMLDFIGIYDPISRLQSLNYLPDLTWDICAFTDTVTDSFGLEIKPNQVQKSLENYDVIIVPGGYGTRKWQFDEGFMNWLKTAEAVKCKASICTGSLLLGAVGFLKDKKATTHFQEYDNLKPFCKTVLTDRIVDAGDVITAGAVSSAIDLGLYLCEKWAGQAAQDDIRKRMDYHG